MDYNKIIIALVAILIILGAGTFALLNQAQNVDIPVSAVANNTSTSVNVDKINTEDVQASDTQQSSGSDSKYVSKEYAQQHMDEWQSGHGYYWVGDTQYDSATGKIIGGGSDEDQRALQEIYGDRS